MPNSLIFFCAFYNWAALSINYQHVNLNIVHLKGEYHLLHLFVSYPSNCHRSVCKPCWGYFQVITGRVLILSSFHFLNVKCISFGAHLGPMHCVSPYISRECLFMRLKRLFSILAMTHLISIIRSLVKKHPHTGPIVAKVLCLWCWKVGSTVTILRT